MKIRDKFDDLILLGIIRSRFKFEKSAVKRTEEHYGNCVGICGLGQPHGREVFRTPAEEGHHVQATAQDY